MTVPSFNTIMVMGDGVPKEGKAYAAFTPGHLLEHYRDGTTGKLRAHSTAGGNVTPRMVAVEDEEQGRPISTAYTAGENAKYRVFQPGDEALLILKEGETIVIGDKLESAGNGEVQKYVIDVDSNDDGVNIYPENIVGVSAYDLDLSDSSGADPASRRLLVEII